MRKKQNSVDSKKLSIEKNSNNSSLRNSKNPDQFINQNSELQYYQPFLKINHRNSNTYFDDESLINLKLNLYTTLASIEEDIVGREINKLFDRLIPNQQDLYKINTTLAKQYYDSNYSKDSSGLKIYEDVKNSLDSILNKNYNMEFYFFHTYIEEVCKVLVYSYLELSNSGKLITTSSNPNYKITNHAGFLKAVEGITMRNVDVIKRYRDRERGYLNGNGLQNKNSMSFSFSNSTSCRSSFSSCGGNTFKYTHSNPNEFEIPTEMILLLNKFQAIKKLKLFVPSVVDDLTPFIFILLNLDWLFPNLFEVELDLSSGSLHKEVYDEFMNGIIIPMEGGVGNGLGNVGGSKNNNMPVKRNSRNTIVNLESDVKSNGKAQNIMGRRNTLFLNHLIGGNSNSYNSNNEYFDLIKNYKKNFELIVIYSFFISKMEKLKILDIIFPDSFQRETEEALKLSEVYPINFQFLNFFTPIEKLYQLHIEFNSLDSNSFEKILSIFHKNNSLKCFKIGLFTNSEENYTKNALVKLCSSGNYEINTLNSLSTDNILSQLLISLEENLEKFFFIFQTKLKLFEFHLKAEFPRAIAVNESYILTFQKFLFNFFTLLNNENLAMQTLKIYVPFLAFDNRKYPGICKFFDTICLHEKQMKMSNLTIFLQFTKCYNISNIISTHLKFLQIGDLDLDTFSNLMKLFTSEKFMKKSQLTCLKIFLSNFIFDFKSVLTIIEPFIKFMRLNRCNLKEFSIDSNLIISNTGEELITLYNLINNDRIEKYCFEFNKRSSEIFTSVSPMLPELRYRVENKKVNKTVFNGMICMAKVEISKKSGDLKNKYRDVFKFAIFYHIQKFLEHYEKKGITVTFK